MSLEYILCPKSTVNVPWLQLLSQEYFYVTKVQFMSQEYSSFPMTTVYVPRVQFISHKYSSFPMTIVYVPRVQFISQEYSSFPMTTVYVP